MWSTLHWKSLKIYVLGLWSIFSMLLLMHLARIENHRLFHMVRELTNELCQFAKWKMRWTLDKRIFWIYFNWIDICFDVTVIYVWYWYLSFDGLYESKQMHFIKSESETKNEKLIIKTYSDTRHTQNLCAQLFSMWLHVIIGHKQKSHTMTFMQFII